MGIIDWLFGGAKKENPACSEALNICVEFLKKAPSQVFSIYTFTELFAFIWFEFDFILWRRKANNGDEILKELGSCYKRFVRNEFKVESLGKHLEILNLRSSEYMQIFQASKEKYEVVKRLTFYLNQAIGLDGYHDNSPIFAGNILTAFKRAAEVSDFYVAKVSPIIKSRFDL